MAVFDDAISYDEQKSEIVFESEYTSHIDDTTNSPNVRNPSRVDSGPGAGSPRRSPSNRALDFENYQGTESKYSIPDETEMGQNDLDESVLNRTQQL